MLGTVAVGGPDGSTGALGAGAAAAGVTVDIAGTTDVLMHLVGEPPVRSALGGAVLNAYLLDDLWAAGGPTGLTGGGLEWLTGVLGYSSVAAAYEALEPNLPFAEPGLSAEYRPFSPAGAFLAGIPSSGAALTEYHLTMARRICYEQQRKTISRSGLG